MTVTKPPPNGGQLASTSWAFHSNFFIDQNLTDVGGTYTVKIDPGGASTGQVTITLYDVVDVTGPIASAGASVPVTLGTPGQNARLSFTGSIGQPVRITTSGVTIEAGTLSLLRPDGTPEPNASVTWSFHQGTTLDKALTAAGTYTVKLDANSDNTGQATVALNPTAAFEPPAQTYGPCDGGLDGLNQSGCWGSVNTLLGAFTTQATDASMPAIGIPFNYTRSYTSAVRRAALSRLAAIADRQVLQQIESTRKREQLLRRPAYLRAAAKIRRSSSSGGSNGAVDFGRTDDDG